MYDFHDAKLWEIKFDFDATDLKAQNLTLDLDYVLKQRWNENDVLINDLCPCNLFFLNVSGFSINFSTEIIGISPLSYRADSLYISSIDLVEKSMTHQVWRILFINDLGEIKVSCDDIKLNIHKEFCVEVQNEMYIPREIRKCN